MKKITDRVLVFFILSFLTQMYCFAETKPEITARIAEIDSKKIPAIKAMYVAIDNAKTALLNLKNKLVDISTTLKTKTISSIQTALTTKKDIQAKITTINQDVVKHRNSGQITNASILSTADSAMAIADKLNQFFNDCDTYLANDGVNALQTIAGTIDTQIASVASFITELDSLYASVKVDENLFLSEKTTLKAQL